VTKKLWMAVAALGIIAVVGLAACEKKTGTVSAPAGGEAGAINWMGFDEGMAKARQESKPVMVDFYTTWCKYCKMLDDTTYKDPEIASLLNSSFVSIKVDAESTDKVTHDGKEMTKAELAKAYGVQGYPTIWFFDEKGEKIGPLPGYSPPEDFKPVLTYISSGAYSKGVQYNDYVNSLKGASPGQPAAAPEH
jgi:thioredoxin-related protein